MNPRTLSKLGLNSSYAKDFIVATGNIEHYLKPDSIRDLGLNPSDITALIKSTENIENYLLPGQQRNDELYFNNIYYKENKEIFSKEILDTLGNLHQKNSSLYSTINFDILFDTEILNICNEEQLLRITHYTKVEEYILRNNNKLISKSLQYLMQKDENWILSLNNIINHENMYKDLINNLQSIDDKKFTPNFIKKFLCVISDSNNYFDIQNYEDVNNYSNKKNEICLNILNGNIQNLPKN